MTGHQLQMIENRLADAIERETRGATGVSAILCELCDARDRGEITQHDFDTLISRAHRTATNKIEGVST